MPDTYFVGLRGTTDLATNERPEAWRAAIMRLFPNGMAPLTALTSMMKSERVDDIHFHWWTKTLTTQRATITGIYTDTALGTPYVSGGVVGSVLYVKVAAASSLMFRVGHEVMLRYSSDYTLDTVAKVVAVSNNGDSSYVACRLLEIDNNSTTYYLASANVLMVIGSINPQGGTRPTAIAQSPSEFDNYTQIFRNALELSRTLEQTKLRTVNAYPEAKRDTLEQHSIEMEKALLWGIRSVGTGDNGLPETTTDGLITFIKAYGIMQDYTAEADYGGMSWIQGGHTWLNNFVEQIFRNGTSRERLVYCGSGALLGIQRLVEQLGMYQISTGQAAYGIKVTRWETVFGDLIFQTHPLFSFEATNRNTMVVFEPKNLVYRYIQDTIFKADDTWNKGGGTGKDGRDEEFLTEAGLEFFHPETCGYFNGVGLDNSLS